MRRSLFIVGIILACTVIVGVIAVLMVDINRFRWPIQRQLESRLHRSVSLGRMELSLLPLSIRIENLAIGESPQFPSQTPFLTARELYVLLPLRPLLKGELQLDRLRLREPVVELIRGVDGRWNITDLGGSSPSSGGMPSELSELEIQDGHVAFTDRQKKAMRSSYDHIDVKVRDFAPGRQFSVISRVSVPEPVEIAFDARYDPATGVFSVRGLTGKLNGITVTAAGEARLKSEPSTLSASIECKDARLADLLHAMQAHGGAVNLRSSGFLSMAIHLQGPLNSLSYQGLGTLRSTSVQLPSLSAPLHIPAASIRLSANRLALENLEASLGASRLRGAVEVEDFVKPSLRFQADVDRLDLAEFQRLAGSRSAEGPAPGASSSIRGSGELTVGTLTYNELVLTKVRAACKFEGGVITFEPAAAELFGGQQTGTIVIDTRPVQASVVIRSKLAKVDANRLLSATTAVRQIFFGSLSGSMDLQITPKPSQDLARALNGSLEFVVEDGRLAGVHLVNEIVKIARLAGYTSQNELATRILKLGGSARLENGRANTENLALDFGDGSLTASGTVGLADQSLKLRITTVLAKELSSPWTSSRPGGILSAALANARGEIVVPSLVSGTFAKPVFTPDAERLAKMQIEGLVPSKDNPQATTDRIRGILDALGSKKPAPPK